MSVVDTNMETLRIWASEFPVLNDLPVNLKNNIEKLIDLVDLVNSCLAEEFAKDNVLCEYYDESRKKQFLNCIKECTKQLTGVDEKYHMNIALRLWPGCMDTTKTLSLKTISGRNTGEKRKSIIPTIHSRASNDQIYRKGAEIACLWEPNSDNICFDGIPVDSLVRKHETEWSKREGVRPVKQCTND